MICINMLYIHENVCIHANTYEIYNVQRNAHVVDTTAISFIPDMRKILYITLTDAILKIESKFKYIIQALYK